MLQDGAWLAGVCVSQCRVDTRKDETFRRRVNKNEFLSKLKASLAWVWHTTIRSTIPSRSAVGNGDTHTHTRLKKRFDIQQQLAVRRKNNKKRWYNTGALYNIGWPMTLLEGTLETTRVHVCACRRRRQKGNKHSKWTRWSQSIKEKMGRRGRNGGLVIAHLKNKLMVYTIAELGPT